MLYGTFEVPLLGAVVFWDHATAPKSVLITNRSPSVAAIDQNIRNLFIRLRVTAAAHIAFAFQLRVGARHLSELVNVVFWSLPILGDGSLVL